MSSFPRVFVYRTLKRGFHNHHFLAGAKFLGTGRTKEKYAMYAEGGIPFVVQGEQVSFIHGELYVVDKMCLRNLDRLEVHTLKRSRANLPSKRRCSGPTRWGEIFHSYLEFAPLANMGSFITIFA